MRRVATLLTVLALGLLAQGCVTTYTPAADEPTAIVRVVGFGSPRMCKDGKLYYLAEEKGAANDMRVPAGTRITFGVSLVSDNYRVVYYCTPYLSFIPYSGQTYVVNGALIGDGKCAIELVQQDPSSKTGLALDYTVNRADCSPK